MVSQGRSSPVNHATGSSVSGVYDVFSISFHCSDT